MATSQTRRPAPLRRNGNFSRPTSGAQVRTCTRGGQRGPGHEATRRKGRASVALFTRLALASSLGRASHREKRDPCLGLKISRTSGRPCSAPGLTAPRVLGGTVLNSSKKHTHRSGSFVAGNSEVVRVVGHKSAVVFLHVLGIELAQLLQR